MTPLGRIERKQRIAPQPVASGEPTGGGLPFWALMAYTVVIVLSPQLHFAWLEPLHIVALIGWLAIVSCAVSQLGRGRPVIEMSRELWLAVALFVWAFFTIPFSLHPGGSFTTLTEGYAKALVLLWLTGHVITTERRYRTVAIVLSLIAVPIAATAIGQYLSGDFDDGLVPRIRGYESTLAGNPNDLAMTLNLILPFTVAIVRTDRRPAVKLALSLIVVGLIVAVICTFSRGGFMTLVVIGLLYIRTYFKRRRVLALILVIAMVLGVSIAPEGYLSRMETISSIDADITGSSQQRWEDMQAAVTSILQRPIIGAGIGSGILALNEVRGGRWLDVHNVYLVYAVDLGLPGLLLFLLLALGVLRKARLVRQRSAEMSDRIALYRLAEATEISLLAFMVAGMFTPGAYLAYFYYFAGLALALGRLGEPLRHASPAADRPLK
jgi:O-antigen ligase